VDAHGLPGNWFWRVGSIARWFYCLKASPKGSSVERFPMLYKKNELSFICYGNPLVIIKYQTDNFEANVRSYLYETNGPVQKFRRNVH
jgi:hypothetical protein